MIYQKKQEILEAVYKDSQGVSAAFNLNMLAHLNWRFDGNFDLNLFQHQAIYNNYKNQIESYLYCEQNCKVRLEKLDLTVELKAGESILTLISRKFNVEQMQEYLPAYGLNLINTWTDMKQWFALLLCQLQS